MSRVVQICAARKSYGSVVALDNLSLTLEEGECLGLLGPNGAGKTTAIRTICGRVRLDSGSVLWNGADARASANLLGLVPQELALFPRLTGQENLEVFGGLHGLRAKALDARVAWALEWCGLADRANEPVQQWSVGMKRRLNIACGILHAPRVILLDEPTAGVDPESRRRIWELLLGLRATGVALLVTTHLLNEAQSVADRIAIINRGKLIACGSAAQIVRDALGAEHHVTVLLANGKRMELMMRDVVGELPRLLDELEARGDDVLGLEVSPPELEDAFLHLVRQDSSDD